MTPTNLHTWATAAGEIIAHDIGVILWPMAYVGILAWIGSKILNPRGD